MTRGEEVDFNVFVGAETGILKGVNVNNKASISKGSNINTNGNRLFAMRELTSPSLSNSRLMFMYFLGRIFIICQVWRNSLRSPA